jgi:formamidopyrimidine-DNA glycosylase
VRFYRRGKFLWLEFERDRVAINAMLTGRLQLAADPGVKKPQKTLFVLSSGPLAGRRRIEAAAWTAARRGSPPNDATPEMRYRDPTQMGKVYLLPPASSGPCRAQGRATMGPDADDPT